MTKILFMTIACTLLTLAGNAAESDPFFVLAFNSTEDFKTDQDCLDVKNEWYRAIKFNKLDQRLVQYNFNFNCVPRADGINKVYFHYQGFITALNKEGDELLRSLYSEYEVKNSPHFWIPFYDHIIELSKPVNMTAVIRVDHQSSEFIDPILISGIQPLSFNQALTYLENLREQLTKASPVERLALVRNYASLLMPQTPISEIDRHLNTVLNATGIHLAYQPLFLLPRRGHYIMGGWYEYRLDCGGKCY